MCFADSNNIKEALLVCSGSQLLLTIVEKTTAEQSCFAFQSMSQLQVPSLQMPWELQSSSIKQTYARKSKELIQINRKYSFKFECDYCIVLPRNCKEEEL